MAMRHRYAVSLKEEGRVRIMEFPLKIYSFSLALPTFHITFTYLNRVGVHRNRNESNFKREDENTFILILLLSFPYRKMFHKGYVMACIS